MKIIQVIFTLRQGGAERFVTDLSNQLADYGHEVTICLIKPENSRGVDLFKSELNPNVKIISLGVKRFRYLPLGWIRMRRLLAREKPDIVHCHLNVIPYLFPAALYKRGIGYIHTIHSLANKSCLAFQRGINKFFYRRELIKPVTISPACDQSYRDFYKLDNASCIENGRSPLDATERADEVKKFIAARKKKGHETVFIHIARYNTAKRQDILIDAFNRLAEERDDFILLILGSRYDLKEARQLQQRAATDRIIFVGECLNVGDYLREADAFCLTSSREGLPLSLLEALGCGVVPICTAVGGIPDVITHGKNGILVKPLSVDAYTEALTDYLEGRYNFSKKELIDYYQSHYSMDRCASDYLDIYRKAISSPS